MRRLAVLLALLLQACLVATAQDRIPLINSGEVIKEGLRLHDEGKYKLAIAEFQKIPRSDTNYVYALYEMAYSLYSDSNFNATKKICEQALRLKQDRPREPDFFYLYGNVVDVLGDPERALRIYDSGLTKYPAYQLLSLNKGVTLMNMKRYEDAEKIFQQLLLSDPFYAPAHFRLSQSAYFQGKLVPAMLTSIGYLMLYPGGPHRGNSISILSNLSSKHEEFKPVFAARKETSSDKKLYGELETLILSKAALDPAFKPSIKLDDQISRQIEVLFEKVRYVEKDNDFYNQFYVPFYKENYRNGNFETFINYIFSSVEVKQVQDYVKKNKKEMQRLVDDLVKYLSTIRKSRELNVAARNSAGKFYLHEEGKLAGVGAVNAAGDAVGPWQYVFPSGNLRTVGAYDQQGNRTGEWKYFHYNGKLRGKEKYVNGKVDGYCVFYFDNGNISEERNYSNELYNGLVKTYFYTGGVKSESLYKEGRKHGESKKYHSNGHQYTLETYSNDTLSGLYKSYYRTGMPEYIYNNVNGDIEGPLKYFHANGNLAFEGQYVKGKTDGLITRYHENGKLRTRETHAAGKIEGEVVEYFDSGEIFSKSIYKNGKVNGDVTYYDKDGKLYSTFVYEKDKLRKASYFNKEGKVIGENKSSKNGIDLTIYYPDGSKRQTHSVNNDGQIEGTQTIYYRTGKPSEISQYKAGDLHGKLLGYYPNGKVKVEMEFKEGLKHGYNTDYFSSGLKELEGWYVDDEGEGIWRRYDEQGKKLSESYFAGDVLNGIKHEFWPNGKVSTESEYVYGWLSNVKQFDTTGNVINEIDLATGQGKYTTLLLNKKVHVDATYVNGNLNGPCTTYFFDGSKEYEQYYKNGDLDSICRGYFYGGTLSFEGKYSRDQKTGTWKFYDIDGKLRTEENYEHGELAGKYLGYYPNGKLESQSTYVKGERQGELVKYDEEGNLLYVIYYKDNLPIGYSYEGKDGKLLPRIDLPAATGKVQTFFRNGNKSAEFEYVEGKLVGADNLYYSNGNIRMKSSEDFGITINEFEEYYPNGKLQKKQFYQNGNRSGHYVNYHANGTRSQEGHYYNGEKHGTVYYYNEKGTVTRTMNYYYGDLLSVTK